MLLETVSQILLTAAVSSVTGWRGDSKRKGALDAITAQSGRRAAWQQLPLSLFSLSVLFALDHLFLKVEREREKNLLCACAYGPALLLLVLSFSHSLSVSFLLSRRIAASKYTTAMGTTPLCPPVHKNKIVFRSFLLTPARHINRAVICTTTVSFREALFSPWRHAKRRQVVIPCLPGRESCILYYCNNQLCAAIPSHSS